MEFGERIKQIRQAKNLTQATVAKALNVSRQTISSWETGNSYPDIDSLIRLSDYYQLSLDTLIKEDAGVTETLRKPEVLQRMRPITQLLLAINCCFIVAVAFAPQLGLVKHILYLMGFLNILAINQLRYFTDSITGATSITRWQRGRSLAYLFAIGLTLLAIGSWVLNLHSWINDLFTFAGALWAVILIMELDKYHKQHKLNKKRHTA